MAFDRVNGMLYKSVASKNVIFKRVSSSSSPNLSWNKLYPLVGMLVHVLIAQASSMMQQRLCSKPPGLRSVNNLLRGISYRMTSHRIREEKVNRPQEVCNNMLRF